MPFVRFTSHLRQHVAVDDGWFPGATVAEVLDAVFARIPRLQSYVRDDQGALRKHVVVFRNSQLIGDRAHQQDATQPDDEIDVLQALSGG